MTEEQKNKCEEVINSSEEKYNEWLKEMNKKIDRKNYRVNIDKFDEEYVFIGGREIIHYLFQHNFAYGNINNLPTFKFVRKHKERAIEYIIELSVSLAKIFNIDITEEKTNRLFFKKSLFQRVGGFMFNDEIIATPKFSDIVYKKIKSKSDLNMKNIGWAIADYFDKTEEQRNKCKEIVNSWNGEIDADFRNSFKSMVKLLMEDKNSNKSPYEITDEILSVIAEVKDFNEVKIEILRLEILDIHFSMSFEGFLSDTRERINELEGLTLEDLRKIQEETGKSLRELSLEDIKKWLYIKKINNAIKIRMD